MGLKPGNKQTEMGVIPEGWDVSTVGREFQIKLGKMLDAEKNVGVRKPYLGNRAVQWNRIDVSGLATVPLTREDMERFRLQKGDLLVCEGGEVGRAAIWDAPIEECYYQKALHRLRPLRGFDARLMVELFHRWSERGFLANYVTQTSIAHLPRVKLMEIPMPVPQPPEQRAIAEALSDVNALLGALDRLIVKKRDLKQATMQQLLTGQTRLPGFHGDWETGKLGSFVLSHNSGVYKNIELYGEGCNIIGVSDLYGIDCVNGQTFAEVPLSSAEQGKYTLKTNDLLYGESSLVREGIARTVYVTERGAGTAFAWHTRRFSVDQNALLSSYLYYYLQSRPARKQMMDQSIQTAITGINTSAYFGCPVLIPPLPEQTAIAEVLTDMDAEIAALEQRLEKTRALKQGMMQELLTGRTRLV